MRERVFNHKNFSNPLEQQLPFSFPMLDSTMSNTVRFSFLTYLKKWKRKEKRMYQHCTCSYPKPDFQSFFDRFLNTADDF